MSSGADAVPALTVPLRLLPVLKERVWGGQRLNHSAHGPPIGEAWLVHEDLEVQGGPVSGRSLATLAAQNPQELLGSAAPAGRFPLLIKLLDCQDWLSVQVHPDDTQARELVGPDENGKTEAWHVLDAAPGAQLIGGVDPGLSPSTLREAILSQDVSSLLRREDVVKGDTFLVRAGTVHALGPGLLIYEVQQTSDTTYRVYDWDRPESAGRALHLRESAQVASVGMAERAPASPSQGAGIHLLTRCEYFTLEQVRTAGQAVDSDTGGDQLHVLTVIQGEAALSTPTEELTLRPFDTVVIPAALGAYSLSGDAVILRATPGMGQVEPAGPVRSVPEWLNSTVAGDDRGVSVE